MKMKKELSACSFILKIIGFLAFTTFLFFTTPALAHDVPDSGHTVITSSVLAHQFVNIHHKPSDSILMPVYEDEYVTGEVTHNYDSSAHLSSSERIEYFVNSNAISPQRVVTSIAVIDYVYDAQERINKADLKLYELDSEDNNPSVSTEKIEEHFIGEGELFFHYDEQGLLIGEEFELVSNTNFFLDLLFTYAEIVTYTHDEQERIAGYNKNSFRKIRGLGNFLRAEIEKSESVSYTYNLNNMLIEATSEDSSSDDLVIERNIISYDEKERIISKIRTAEDMANNITTTFLFDYEYSDDTLTRIITSFYQAEDMLSYRGVTHYSPQSYIATRTFESYALDGSVAETILEEYDNGRISLATAYTYNPDGALLTQKISQYSYSADGFSIVKNTTDASGKLFSKNEIDYDISGERIKETYTTYDNEGNVLREEEQELPS